MSPWIVLLVGGLIGAGTVVAVAGLSPARPDLALTIQRFLPDAEAVTPRSRSARRSDRLRAAVLPHAVQTFGLNRYVSDLGMVDETAEDLAARKLGYAALGLAFPPLMSVLLLATGIQMPFVVPTVAGLALGTLFFVLPDLNLRSDAAAARASMRSATCVYLELVAMERLGDAGPSEALDRAASIGDSREFARIRDALLRAELTGQPSWSGLTDLAATTGVTELADAADIMRIAGQDGGAIYSTLRARAASLRTQLLAISTAKANAASEHMVVPVSLLGLCFMALLGYPAFMRILFG